MKDILSYLSSDKKFYSTISESNVIELRFSGDGRRTTKKLGSTMTAFAVPRENLESRSPDKEYCVSIYDGKKTHYFVM